MSHVSDDVLFAYCRPPLDPSNLTRVEHHLQQCLECRRRLADILGQIISEDRKRASSEVEKAREELKAVLSVRQEAALVSMGILE